MRINFPSTAMILWRVHTPSRTLVRTGHQLGPRLDRGPLAVPVQRLCSALRLRYEHLWRKRLSRQPRLWW